MLTTKKMKLLSSDFYTIEVKYKMKYEQMQSNEAINKMKNSTTKRFSNKCNGTLVTETPINIVYHINRLMEKSSLELFKAYKCSIYFDKHAKNKLLIK
jgi:hypothetical protein